MISEIKKIIKYFFFPKKEKVFFTKEFLKNWNFQIGDYTYGNPRILFPNDKSKLTIGKFCSIAEGVTIFLGGNHRLDWVSTYPFNKLHNYFPEAKIIEGHPATNGDVVIKNDVWIGLGVTIMSGVTIGNGAVVGAGALVTKDIGDYEIWGGNPAKFIKNRFKEDSKLDLLELEWWNWELGKINKNVELLCSNNMNALIKNNIK